MTRADGYEPDDQRLERLSSPATPTSITSSGRPMDSAALLGRSLQQRRAPLRQPHHSRVVAEVVVAQIGVPVETELDDDAAPERRGKEVGEQVGSRLLLEQRPVLVDPGVDAVAVRARQSLDPVPLADLVERAVGAAVGVGD